MPHVTHRRNRDFVTQCKKSARHLRLRGRKPSIDEIVRHALAQTAPTYYAEYYRACAMLRHYGTAPRAQRPYAASGQWADMAADLARLKAANPGVNDRFLIYLLVTGKAGSPRFYLSKRRALEIATSALAEMIA